MSRGLDREAQFTDVMQTHAAAVRRLCAAYASTPQDRDDLFQEIFLGVWRALPAYRGAASVRTWLYRIAHNVALTWQVRARRRDSHEAPLNEDVAAASEMDVRRLALTRAVAQMKPVDRALTVLWLEGLTAAEIEEVTGVKAATVAVRLSRIRKHLQPAEEP